MMTENFDVINAPQYFDFIQPLDEVDDTFFDTYKEEDPLKMNIYSHQDEINQEVSQKSCKDYQIISDKISQEVLQKPCEEYQVIYEENSQEVSQHSCNEYQSMPNEIKHEVLQKSCEKHQVISEENSQEVSQQSCDEYESMPNETKHEVLQKSCEESQSMPSLRKSLSSNDLMYLEMAFETQTVSETRTKKERLHVSSDDFKRFGAVPQRSQSKDCLTRLAQPKKKFGSEQSLKSPYVTMAEAVQKFQQRTPERFRSKPKPNFNRHLRLEATVPNSPHLISNLRTRPVHFVSHAEQEQIDYEEAQKFKIKAHPVNKKVLHGPLKPTVPVEKRPCTVPEPFKLTEVHTKVIQSPRRAMPEFHPNPVPDFSKGAIPKSVTSKPNTIPQTPNVLKRSQGSTQRKMSFEPPQQEQKPRKLTRTQPLPFSFDARNAALKTKKEEFIRRVYDEEKKAREFHARPIPKTVLQAPKNLHRSPLKAESKTRFKSEENLSAEFKARPPTVLYKKPFEPKKDENHLIEISEFILNTDQRAREREAFELQLKDKEERMALAKEKEEQMRIQQEIEEGIKFRKMTEYKAQPIKKYKGVIIQPSGKITEPISPKFHSKKNHKAQSFNDNKENSI